MVQFSFEAKEEFAQKERHSLESSFMLIIKTKVKIAGKKGSSTKKYSDKKADHYISDHRCTRQVSYLSLITLLRRENKICTINIIAVDFEDLSNFLLHFLELVLIFKKGCT